MVSCEFLNFFEGAGDYKAESLGKEVDDCVGVLKVFGGVEDSFEEKSDLY